MRTVNLRLMAIRSFAKYSSIINPAKIYFQVELGNVSSKKSAGKVVEFLSTSALEVLFSQPGTSKFNGFRDFCYMKLMYDVAARCQELLDVKIGDLNLKNGHPTVFLNGKGEKTRAVPISTMIANLLRDYLDKVHPIENRRNSDFLFFTTTHGQRHKMSTDAVSLFMRKYGERGRVKCSEIPERVHPHQLRHSRAMHLYRGGVPLVLLSEFLGHASIDTTRVYAWADTEMKRKAILHISQEDDTIVPLWQDDEVMIKKLYLCRQLI